MYIMCNFFFLKYVIQMVFKKTPQKIMPMCKMLIIVECNLSTLFFPHSQIQTPEIDERNLNRCSRELLDVIMSSLDQYDDRKLLPSLSS